MSMHCVWRRSVRAWWGVRGVADGGGAARGRLGAAGGGRSDDVAEQSPLRRLVRDASEYSEAAAGEGELHWATQPYAARPPSDDEPHQPRRDPRDHSVLLFPGQGAQYPGMGRRLLTIPAAKEVYDFASEILGWDVARLCVEGGEAEQRARAQSCVMVTALAGAAALREERPGTLEGAAAACGFSLGELAALAWAGALAPGDALRVLAVREEAMRAAAAERRGAMLTVWLAPAARLSQLLAGARDAARSPDLPDPVALVANYLYPDCKVLAGDEECMSWVERSGRALGVRRAARVRVAGAFHSPLMARARDALREALAAVEVRAPRVPVVSAVDARPYRGAGHVRAQLARQVVAPVRWEQCLHALAARARDQAMPRFVLLPPAAATRHTLRMVNARAWDAAVLVPDS